MSLPEFQRALAEMTLDAALAARVKQQGAQALQRYALDAREQQRLLQVAQQPGMVLNCTLARTNRFTAIAESYPMSCVVVEPVLRELLDALWSQDRPAGYQLTSDVAAFARRLQRDRALHRRFEYLREVFAYERACIALVNQTRRVALTRMAGRVRVVDFEHDPAELLSALQRHQAPPPGLPRVPHRMEIELVHGVLESRWFAVANEAANGAVMAGR